jgi:hypothetical protein
MSQTTGPNYQVIAGDWQQLESIINDLTQRFITQGLTSSSSPTFAGLTLSGLTASTASKVVFTNSSKGLTSTGIGTPSQFIKGDGSLDSTTYLSVFTETDPLSWSIANIQTGLTGNKTGSFNLITSGNIIGGQAAFNTTAISTTTGIYSPYSTSTAGAIIIGVDSSALSTPATSITGGFGQKFSFTFAPPVLATSKISSNAIDAAFGNIVVTRPSIGSSNNLTSGPLKVYDAKLTINGGTGSGVLNITNSYNFYANTPTISNTSNVSMVNLYAFYDDGQVATGVSNAWGLAINTKSYINANLSIGKNTAPAYPLDVIGDISSSTLFRIGATTGINATVSYVDTLLGAKTLTFVGGILTAQV